MPSENQHTLAQSAGLSGTALHTGEEVRLTLHPAPPNHGIKFRRLDIEDRPLLDATIENVKMVERATTLMAGSMRIHTCEHVLAALVGMEIDNAVIELDANEPPIADGSARPYVELIRQAGVEEQDTRRRYFDVREPVHVETKSGAVLSVFPDDEFRVSCTQAGPDPKFTQFYAAAITPEVFAEEIAPARTFVHYEDIEPLIEKGLIKGGSIQNAIVIKDSSLVTKEPMRFPEELARHKILDIIGDLSLFGLPIRGHVVAVKPGHAANADFVRALAKEKQRLDTMVPPAKIPKGEGALDINEVMDILPHRFPFLMVDRIVAFDGENKCTGVKAVSMNEPFFIGHFPNHPVMPGVLQVEAMAQVASILLLRLGGKSGQVGYFMSADEVKFRKPVFPGDTIFIHAELQQARRNIGKAWCKCVVNDEIVSEGELKFALMEL